MPGRNLGRRAVVRTAPELPTFRGGVRVIEVDAIVRDRDGNFVDNLTKDDFELLEDGRRQDIQNLSMVKLPVGQKGRPLDPAALALSPQASDANLGRRLRDDSRPRQCHAHQDRSQVSSSSAIWVRRI